MKSIEFSPEVSKKIQNLNKNNPKFAKKIAKQLALFKNNPKHLSLRLHKIKKDNQNIWSILIDKGYRMLYLEDEKIYFFAIGTHDEVYK